MASLRVSVYSTERHEQPDILILAICALVGGAEGWEAIELFGKDKEDWPRQWLDLKSRRMTA